MKNKIYLIKHILFGNFRWINVEYQEGKLYIDGVELKNNQRFWVLGEKHEK